MGSRKPSAKAKQVAAFKAKLGGMDDIFTREEHRRTQRAAEHEEALREKASQETIFSVLSSRKTLVCMKKTTLRMLLAVMGVAVIVYGLISGRLAESFHQTPYSTGFIVVILLIYAVVLILVMVVPHLKIYQRAADALRSRFSKATPAVAAEGGEADE